ncbi:Testis-specific protein TEX28/transmembrane and coiled-coil domains protein [Trinorchestia longiramus]|nr:Testis-specific protein TEX28/transmembrane and coiled-coil domains protein [Trinorchestia longiramus]
MSSFATDMGRSSSKGSTRPEVVENGRRARSSKQSSQIPYTKSNTTHHANNSRHNNVNDSGDFTHPAVSSSWLTNTATNSLGNVHQSSLSNSNRGSERYDSSATSRHRKDHLLEGSSRLQKHRRSSSDCCLYEIDNQQQNQDAVAVNARHSLNKQMLSSSTSLSRPSTLLTQSRPNSPMAGFVTTLDPRRSASPSCYSGTTSPHSMSRPVTPVSHHPLAHSHLAHLFQSLEAPQGDRSSSRASVPEILVSDDFGSPSTSTGSSPLSGGDFYGSGNEGDNTRKKNHESRSEDLYHSTRRRSPMTGRRALDNTGTNTPPTSSSSSGTTPLQARARAHSAVTAAAVSSGSVSSPYTDELLTHSPNDEWEQDVTGMSSAVSNGSGEVAEMLRGVSVDVADDTDGSRTTQQHLADKIKEASEHLQSKMLKTRDLIKQEQKARDDNVNEYLKCAASADKLQISRIKAVFEKKNQKSAASIQHLQKKLDTYQKRLQDLQTHGLATQHRQPKEVLRDMGQGLKTGLISKPREFAHLIKNKFGSVDNIKEIVSDEDRDEEKTHHGSATLPPGVSLSSIPPTSNTVAAAAVAANCLLQQPAIAQSGVAPAPSSGPLPTNINRFVLALLVRFKCLL